MKTTQAWAWLTAAVMAAGLNASYHDGGLQWAHRIAEQAGYSSRAVLALARGHADQFLEEARLATRGESAPCAVRVVLTRVQEKVAGEQQRVAWVQEKTADGEQGIAQIEEMSARQQERLARMEEMRARIEERLAERAARCRNARAIHAAAFVVTPDFPVRVNVPAVQIPAVEIPQIRVPQVRVPEVRVPEIHLPEIHVPAIHVESPQVDDEAGAGPV